MKNTKEKTTKPNIMWRLFIRFFCIGAITFGGGYSMIPMFERELAERENWVTSEELLDYYTVSQCTPGIIAVNTATFVGHKIGGAAGAAAATLGVITPSLIVITLIAALFDNFMSVTIIQYALNGIKIAVAGLIISAVVKLLKSNVKNAWGAAIAAAVFVTMLAFGLSPVIYVLAAFALGLILYAVSLKKQPKNPGGTGEKDD